MDKKDLEQIRQAVKEEVIGGFAQVWEHNLEPAFDAINERFDKIEGQVNQLPTKAYLDDKIAGLSGDLITKLRREDEKVNRLLDILRTKNVLSDNDLTELSNLVVFPK